MDNAKLQYFSDYIQKEIGIVYVQSNFFQLEKRLVEISKSLGLADEEALFQAAKAGLTGAAKQLLLDVSTNNETSFFRDPKVFRLIENHIIPGILKDNPGQPIVRVWCAASSTGQEPYSLALSINEMREKGVALPRFEILATDVSESVLARAAEGKFSQLEVQRGLPAALLVKYFTKSNDDFWTLNKNIRYSVQFKKQNLLESFSSLGQYDFVLCRNVLIYQTEDRKRAIVAEIAKHLSPNGALVLGAAESLIGISEEFQQICEDGAIFYKKKV